MDSKTKINNSDGVKDGPSSPYERLMASFENIDEREWEVITQGMIAIFKVILLLFLIAAIMFYIIQKVTPMFQDAVKPAEPNRFKLSDLPKDNPMYMPPR